MIWFAGSILSGVIITALAVFSGRESDRRGDLSPRVWAVSMMLLAAGFAFLLFYRVSEIPVPFNVDEAGMAYDAKSLAAYRVDRYLYHFPVYLVNFGGGQSALYAYLAAILIRLFGYSVLIVRLPAVLLSLLSALVFSLTVREEHGNAASVTALAFFCILPFSLMHSRWGLDAYLLFPMLILACAAFYQAVRTGKTWRFFLSGCLFGLTLYSYVISYMILPLFLAFCLLYLLWARRISLKNLLAMALPLLLTALPLLLMVAVNSGLIPEVHTRFFTIPKLNGFRSGEIGLINVLNNLKFDGYNIFYEIFVNDHCRYNVNPKFGTLYYVSIPILIYGIISRWQGSRKSQEDKLFSLDLMMFFLLAAGFCISMLVERPNVNRSCAVYIPLIYFLTMGTREILKKSRIAAAGAALCFLVSFALFLNYYFNRFPKDLESDILFTSAEDLGRAMDFAETVYRDDETVYITGGSNPYIYTLLLTDTDPYTFNEKKILSYDNYVKAFDKYRFRLDAVLTDCIYIFTHPGNIPEDFDSSKFLSRQFGPVIVYYPPAEQPGSSE